MFPKRFGISRLYILTIPGVYIAQWSKASPVLNARSLVQIWLVSPFLQVLVFLQVLDLQVWVTCTLLLAQIWVEFWKPVNLWVQIWVTYGLVLTLTWWFENLTMSDLDHLTCWAILWGDCQSSNKNAWSACVTCYTQNSDGCTRSR